jgi:hypothetical protein
VGGLRWQTGRRDAGWTEGCEAGIEQGCEGVSGWENVQARWEISDEVASTGGKGETLRGAWCKAGEDGTGGRSPVGCWEQWGW